MSERPRVQQTVRVLRAVLRQPSLRRAEVAFALSITSEAAFTVALGVVSFRDRGAAGVGLVALVRMLPSAIGTTVLTPYADRVNRAHVLGVLVVLRAACIAASDCPPIAPWRRHWASTSPP